jgi:hypothetical protein
MSARTIVKISDVVILLIDNVSTTPPRHVSAHDSLGLPSIHPNGLTGLVVVVVVVDVVVIKSATGNHATDKIELKRKASAL